MPAVIAFSQVCKRYPGGHEALSGITFTIEPGELVFVTGPSGAGKSTLLKLVAAIERPSSGAVLVGNQNVSTLKRAAVPFLRRNLGLVLQDRKLLHDRSVFDNVMLPMIITGQQPLEAARRARAALDKVGLLEREKAMPVSLSGGEQQRVCIARAMVNRPGILIADEPTASLDADCTREVMGLFHAFHQVGVTVLIATHDHAALLQRSPRVIPLHRGRLA